MAKNVCQGLPEKWSEKPFLSHFGPQSGAWVGENKFGSGTLNLRTLALRQAVPVCRYAAVRFAIHFHTKKQVGKCLPVFLVRETGL